MQKLTNILLVIPLVTTVFIASCSSAGDEGIPQFRGPNRDGKFNETGLLQQWPANGPEVLLEYTGIGEGYSSVITNGKYIYASGRVDTSDYLTCIDYEGNKRWQVRYGTSWNQSYPGNRASVTIDGDRLYVISGTGELSCLDAKTGESIWYRNVDEEYEAVWHTWGCAESPLVLDNMVFCTPGGEKTTMVAFDKMTGAEIWKTRCVGGERGYISPTRYTYNGANLILGATAKNLFAVDPATGDVKMVYDYNTTANDVPQVERPGGMQAGRPQGAPPAGMPQGAPPAGMPQGAPPARMPQGAPPAGFGPPAAPTTGRPFNTRDRGQIWVDIPTIKNNMIFLSMGYNKTAVMLRVNDSNTAFEEVYRNNVLDNHHGGLIEVDGYLYGSNWLSNNSGNWVCLDWNTGETMWEHTWTSKGSMVYADGMLYIYDEKSGELGLLRPNTTKFDLVSSFKVEKGRGEHWSHPFFHDGKMFHRHGDVLTVYKVK